MGKIQARHMMGLRMLLVLVIPLTYYTCANFVRFFENSANDQQQPEQVIRWRKLLAAVENETTTEENCTPPAIQEFPSDGLTRAKRQSGYIIIHFFIAIYLFLLLAIVCDDFFVPSIKKICDCMHVSKDVAGATFMAAATSSPELFINIVGTFVTEDDLGVGTIVGSAVFNILAVPACCGLFAAQMLQLHWWPITRDCLAYLLTVILLILTLRDGRIEWYEALILVFSYVFYLMVILFNRRIGKFMGIALSKKRKYRNMSENHPLISNNQMKDNMVNSNKAFGDSMTNGIIVEPLVSKKCGSFIDDESYELIVSSDEEAEDIVNMMKWPSTITEKIWWIVTWPINLVLLLTIPDCRRPTLRNAYPLTFLMCIVWIATMSYVVGWDITIIGDTLKIPDSVMGLTFLAAGMSVPEAVSSIIVTNQGLGSMGISNSIGSNVFDVLLCLGLPWLVKSIFAPKVPGEYYVQINSQGIIYSSVSLFSTLIFMYLALAVNKFRMDKKIGFAFLVVYATFLLIASLVELNFFFVVNLPTCVH